MLGRRLAPLLPLVLALLGAAAAQSDVVVPEAVLRHLAGDADVALLDCPPTLAPGREGRVLLCGRYEYGIRGFQMDMEHAAERLVAFGDWSADEGGTYTRTYLDADAGGRGVYHVGFHDGAVMLTYAPRGG